VPYPYERPWGAPVVVGQVPDKEAHNASHDHAGDQLERPEAMEYETWVVRGCHFGAAIEGVVHRVGGAMGGTSIVGDLCRFVGCCSFGLVWSRAIKEDPKECLASSSLCRRRRRVDVVLQRPSSLARSFAFASTFRVGSHLRHLGPHPPLRGAAAAREELKRNPPGFAPEICPSCRV